METCNPTAIGQSLSRSGRGVLLSAAATGKILLTLKDGAFLDEYLRRPRRAFTSNTNIGEEEISADILDAISLSLKMDEPAFAQEGTSDGSGRPDIRVSGRWASA